MSFYDDASIVMIPSGYKASKLYCAKPTDGAGDLTFTRTGSTATRVNESGLIEKCRTNLVLNSATLVTQNVTVVAAPHTLSIFGTGSVVLSGAAIATLTGTGAANRVSLTFTPTAGTLILTVAGSVTSAQLEIGDIATDYIPTTAASITVGPIANLPRLDYTGGGCPKLLMEPARTNLVAFSEQFDNAYWSKGNLTISQNNATSPDGYISSDRIVETIANGQHLFFRQSAVVNGSTYTYSIFIKAQERSFASMQLSDTVNRFTVLFDLNLGTVLTTRNIGVPLNTSNSITSYGNGWYRCSITMTQSILTTMTEIVALSNSDSPTWNATDAPTYTGNTSFGLLAYGAQLELGAYATSYIPTVNASVTRNEDICNKTSISSLIGQTEGTMFIEVNISNITTAKTFISLSSNSASNRNEILILESGVIRAIFIGAITRNLDSSPVTNGVHKVAITYSSSNFKLFLNGSLVASIGGTTLISNYTKLVLGSRFDNRAQDNLSDSILKSVIFPIALSDVDAIALTS